jgi:hypothetical protein
MKKFFLTTLMMVITFSVNAQAGAYICYNSGTPTNVDPIIDIYGDEEDDLELGFGIAGEQDNVLRETPSAKGKPIKVKPSYLFEVTLRPLEIRGKWIKVITSDNRYTG